MPTTRFAPSPTGYLHLGHAYSAFFAERAAAGGSFILRIEDIDPQRCKPQYREAILEDMSWLGLSWKKPVRLQSKHMSDYASALGALKAKGLLYPCFCTRGDIKQEMRNAVIAPHREDKTALYPGTCRHLSAVDQGEEFAIHGKANWRLDVEKALTLVGPLYWHDRVKGEIKATPEEFGDIVLARKDISSTYHLSVTVDDHLQGIELVTRGEDLFSSTHIHRLLQALLGYKVPDYYHHPIQTDANGKRFAKRDQAVTLRSLREEGVTPQEIKARFF